MITMDGKYTTRDGDPVRILAVDRARSNTPVVFLLTLPDGREYVDCCDLNGKWSPTIVGNSGRDLIPAKQYRFKTLAELCKDYPDLTIDYEGNLYSPSKGTILDRLALGGLGTYCYNPEAWDSNLLTEIKPDTCIECPF